jgi:serine/threonine protein kinase
MQHAPRVRFGTTLARVELRPPRGPAARQPFAWGPGTVLADVYEIRERLGSGGMAAVYRAYDRRLGREVAVKVPRLDRGDSDHMLAMFEHEVRATARLAHPNIVALHHIGEHRGVPFVILELLRGETLADCLERAQHLSSSEASWILDRVLAALACAHQHGVVHRDVTPRNVFLTEDQQVKLLDFGVALDHHASPTTLSCGAGTPGYMPPEHEAEPGPRGDLWAAAVLFLECVTGQPPCPTAPPLTVPADLPAPLAAMLRRALHPDPKRRPHSAAAMRRGLRLRDHDERRGRRQRADAAPSADRPTSRARRGRLAVAIALAIAALVAVALASPW